MDETPENDEYFLPEEIQLPEIDAQPHTLFELASFIAQAVEEEMRMASLTKDYLDRLYDKIGSPEDAATSIISYVQRRHGWDVELLAEKREVEEMLFRRYSHYDERIWEKVLNTDALSDLHHEVYKLSQTYIARAIDEVLEKEQSGGYDGHNHDDCF